MVLVMKTVHTTTQITLLSDNGSDLQGCRHGGAPGVVLELQKEHHCVVGFQNSIPCKEELENASYGLYEYSPVDRW